KLGKKMTGHTRSTPRNPSPSTSFPNASDAREKSQSQWCKRKGRPHDWPPLCLVIIRERELLAAAAHDARLHLGIKLPHEAICRRARLGNLAVEVRRRMSRNHFLLGLSLLHELRHFVANGD